MKPLYSTPVMFRPMKEEPSSGIRKSPFVKSGLEDGHGRELKPPYLPGEKCYVRERWCRATEKTPDGIYYPDDNLLIWFDGNEPTIVREATKKYPRDGKLRPAITMPEILARRFVTILSCEPVRVSEITDDDALAFYPYYQGIDNYEHGDAKHWFIADWENKHPGKWAWRVDSQPFGITE